MKYDIHGVDDYPEWGKESFPSPTRKPSPLHVFLTLFCQGRNQADTNVLGDAGQICFSFGEAEMLMRFGQYPVIQRAISEFKSDSRTIAVEAAYQYFKETWPE